MKYFIPVVLLFLAVGCKDHTPVSVSHIPPVVDTLVVIPDTTVAFSELQHIKNTSVWTWNGQPFSGYAISFYQDSSLSQQVGFSQGKKEGKASRWYPAGHLRQIATYHQGKLHGEKKVWSPDASHVLLSHLRYHLGKPHGEQATWYPTGELHKKLTLHMGREEGIQQAFRTNGALYANYEAKNGRIFGLKKASLCFGLEDEK